MSQPVASPDSAVPGSKGSVDDIFKELGKDDPLDSLDLTKPIKSKADNKDDKSDKTDKLETTDDDKKEDLEDNGDKEGKDEEVDELALLEEELEDVDDEKLELKTPVPRREILKKYPNIFKEFPYLETAYYREQQFTEIHGTIEEARQARESHEVLQRFSEDMIEKGNINNVLKMIQKDNPETFAQVVDGYLDHLGSVDPAALTLVKSNLVKNIIVEMVEEAKSSGEDDFRTAALLLNKWAFGTSRFTPPQKMAKEVKAEDKTKESSIAQREKEFAERQTREATDAVNTRVTNTIKAAIESNIDPNSTMTDYVKRNAVRDAMEKVNNLIDRDVRFQKIVDKLWERAAKANFSNESKDEIRKAYLSKARSLLAPVIKSARNEALKGMGKKVREDKETDDNEDTPTRQRTNPDKKDDRSERRPSSDKNRAMLDSTKGKSSYEALNALMGD